MQQQYDNISALSLFEAGLTKSNIKSMADEAMNNILENGNILQAAESVAAMELFIKELKDKKEFKEYVREEAGKTPKGFVSFSGAKIELCETGTAYNFSLCGDPEWHNLQVQLATLKEKIKIKEDFLKTVPASGIDVRFEDQLITVFPPSKTSTSSYKVSLAK